MCPSVTTVRLLGDLKEISPCARARTEDESSRAVDSAKIARLKLPFCHRSSPSAHNLVLVCLSGGWHVKDDDNWKFGALAFLSWLVTGLTTGTQCLSAGWWKKTITYISCILLPLTASALRAKDISCRDNGDMSHEDRLSRQLQ